MFYGCALFIFSNFYTYGAVCIYIVKVSGCRNIYKYIKPLCIYFF